MLKEHLLRPLRFIKYHLRSYQAYHDLLNKYLSYRQKFRSRLTLKEKRNLEKLREYYKTAELFLPLDSKFRHFKFVMIGGYVIKIKKKINNVEQLRKLLIKYVPISVYCSTGLWLNPHKLGPKTYKSDSNNSYVIDDAIFLKQDLIIDLDRKKLEEAHSDAQKLLQYFDTERIKVHKIVFSGSKGFHFYIEDHTLDGKQIPSNPTEREIFYAAERNEFLKNLPIVVDSIVSSNVRGVLRLPRTVNTISGRLCKEISRDELFLPFHDLLERIPKICDAMPKRQVFLEFPKLYQRFIDLTDFSAQHTDYYARYISSVIPGIKNRMILILRYRNMNLEAVNKICRKLIEKFELTNLYIYSSHVKEEYYVVCLKSLTKNIIKKINEQSNSDIIPTNQSPICMIISEKKSYDGKFIAPAPVLIKEIPGKVSNSYISRPHAKHFGIKSGNPCHGTEKPIIYLTKIYKNKVLSTLRV